MYTELLHKAIVAQFITEVFQHFSDEHLHHLVGVDCRFHPWADLGIADGPTGIKQVLPMLRTAFSNPRVEVPDMLAEGDRVVARYVFEADHTGELMGRPATGRRVRLPGILIARLRDGKLAEYWREEDQWGLMRQIDLSPVAATRRSA